MPHEDPFDQHLTDVCKDFIEAQNTGKYAGQSCEVQIARRSLNSDVRNELGN